MNTAHTQGAGWKGISPLISLALLLALTVGISAIIVGFVQQTGEEQTGQISDRAGQEITCQNAGILITDAFFQHPADGTGSNYTTAVVKNTGSTRLPDGIILSAFHGDTLVNTTGMLAALTVDEERAVTFITNATFITRVHARSRDCPEKTSSFTDMANESYVSTPGTGVS